MQGVECTCPREAWERPGQATLDPEGTLPPTAWLRFSQRVCPQVSHPTSLSAGFLGENRVKAADGMRMREDGRREGALLGHGQGL